MEAIRRGRRIVQACIATINADRELLALPALSFVVVTVLAAVTILWTMAAVLGVGFGIFARSGPIESDDPRRLLAYLVLVPLGIGGVLIGYVANFFNAALIGAVKVRLDAGDPKVRDGLRIAWRAKWRLLKWTLLSRTVGLVLRALEKRLPIVADFVLDLVGIAWGLVTYLMLPVTVFDDVPTRTALRRAAELFRARWGAQVTGASAIGLSLFIASVPAWIVVAVVARFAPGVAALLFAIFFGALLAAAVALTGVFKTALYQYAATGHAGGSFDDADLQASFRPFRRRSLVAGPVTEIDL